MSRKSTFEDDEVAMRVTASTAMGASIDEYSDTIWNRTLKKALKFREEMLTLELREVVAARSRLARSRRSTGVDMSVR